MKIKLVACIAGISALCLAAVAYGAATYTAAGSGSTKAGTPDKPAAFKDAEWHYTAVGPNASRAPSPDYWVYAWEGVVHNGKDFPTCTAAEIDAVQSDANCPKKSLVATAVFTAKLGPENDTTQSVSCTGKTVNMYNAGKKGITWLVVGPPDNCAGVGYLPPFTATIKNEKGLATGKKPGPQTSFVKVTLPPNVKNPLPGIEGGLDSIDVTFKNLKTKVDGKTVYYLASTGCDGERDFSFTTVDKEGTHVNEASAGACK